MQCSTSFFSFTRVQPCLSLYLPFDISFILPYSFFCLFSPPSIPFSPFSFLCSFSLFYFPWPFILSIPWPSSSFSCLISSGFSFFIYSPFFIPVTFPFLLSVVIRSIYFSLIVLPYFFPLPLHSCNFSICFPPQFLLFSILPFFFLSPDLLHFFCSPFWFIWHLSHLSFSVSSPLFLSPLSPSFFLPFLSPRSFFPSFFLYPSFFCCLLHLFFFLLSMSFLCKEQPFSLVMF